MTGGIKSKKKHHNDEGLWIALGIIIFFVMFFLSLKVMGIIGRVAEVTVSAADVEVMQSSGASYTLSPAISITSNRDKKIKLNKETEYTVGDLVSDLENSKDLSFETDANLDKEGNYAIRVTLSDELQKKISTTWKKKLHLNVVDGTFHVTNPVGTWDGDQFKRYDGSYVTSDFVVSKGKTYYFDGDGNKVTGRQVINDKTYFFGKKGAMKTGWHQTDDGKYYLGEDGAAVIGWYTVDDADYYFDEDGHMVTGEMQVGLSKCTFDEDGKLVSEEKNVIDPNKPAIALTFDDGPGERTHELLDQLEKYNAHATFFMQGIHVPNYPDEVAKMKEIGCERGNHSYNHPQLTKLSASAISEQMSKTNNNISSVIGESATVMRPPYGAINETVRSNVGLPMILWSLDTLDWKTRNAQASIDTVMNDVQDGDIILMHDIHTESIDAALELIPKLQDAGYQLVTVSELAELKGVTLENGEKYSQFK